MNFSAASFAPFLLLVLVLNALLPSARARVVMLLAASYLFYCWFDARFGLLLLFSSLIDFFIGRRIAAAVGGRTKKRYLLVSLVTQLGVLALFKYADLGIDTVNAALLASGFGDRQLPRLDITLPIGISFYTFQTLSYTLDIYFGKLEPEPKLQNFLLFVAVFPQLVAGPIVRAADLLPQLRTDFFKRRNAIGLFHVVYGLAKKLLLADPLGALLVDPVFAAPQIHSPLTLITAVYAYGFQIFLDFSAYSDIAIGVGRLLGLELMENFRAPYLAGSLRDFWRRWHISLSTWFRDYLYVPLGGNRIEPLRRAFATFLVFLLSGLWHGAAWSFAAWGALHGAALLVERRLGALRLVARLGERCPRLLRFVGWFLTYHLVTGAWILFRAPSLSSAWRFVHGLVVPSGATSPTRLTPAVLLALGVSVLLHLLAEPRRDVLAQHFLRLNAGLRAASVMALLVGVYLLAEHNLVHQAFIYFQF